MTNDDFVRRWMSDVGLDSRTWPAPPDPAWVDRQSLFEMQLEDAVDLAFDVAIRKQRHTDSLHRLVTRAIAHMVPAGDVSNAELLHILFGSSATLESSRDRKREVRHFRNAERALKMDTAARYIVALLHAQKIQPGDGGRLWYVCLLHASGIAVINNYLRRSDCTDPTNFNHEKKTLIDEGHERFAALWEASLRKSQALAGHPKQGIRRFMDFGAFVQWKESNVKRNPMIGIKKMIDFGEIFNDSEFVL